jgi:hypothetical protein
MPLEKKNSSSYLIHHVQISPMAKSWLQNYVDVRQ